MHGKVPSPPQEGRARHHEGSPKKRTMNGHTSAPKPPGTSGTPQKTGYPPRKFWLLFAGVLLVNWLITTYFFPGDAPLTVPYNLFREEAGKGNVSEIYSRGTAIEGRFKAPVTWPAPKPAAQPGQPAPPKVPRERPIPGEARGPSRTASTFTTELPAFFDRNLESFLIEHGVEISAVPIQQGSLLATLLYGFGPAVLLIGFYVWMYRRAAKQGGGMGGGGGFGGGLFGLGRSKAKRYDAADAANRVTFEDVAGIDEAENELVEIRN